MGNLSTLFTIIFQWPIIISLIAIYHVLIAFHVPYALGFSIIALTILIRLALAPLSASQLRTSKKMQDISPHLSRLKDKHKNDAKTLQQETMKLYKEHGVNPLAGCLPSVLQLVVLIFGLYPVFQHIASVGAAQSLREINVILSTAHLDFLKLTTPYDPHFFGVLLGDSPATLIKSVGPSILIIPIFTGILQFIQSKMMIPVQPVVKDKKAKETKSDDFASAFQTQSLYIFPLMIGYFSYTFPIGLTLYWNTFSLFGILQQYQIQGLGGLTGWVNILRGKK